MGGFTSPGCAQCVASVAEYTCMRTFLTSSCLFGARFMDDTLSIINLTRVQQSSTHLLTLLQNAFCMYSCAGLEVELEAAGTTATMLMSRVSVARGVQCSSGTKTHALLPQACSACAVSCPAFP